MLKYYINIIVRVLLVFPDENKFPLVKHAVWTAFTKIPAKLTLRRSF